MTEVPKTIWAWAESAFGGGWASTPLPNDPEEHAYHHHTQVTALVEAARAFHRTAQNSADAARFSPNDLRRFDVADSLREADTALTAALAPFTETQEGE